MNTMLYLKNSGTAAGKQKFIFLQLGENPGQTTSSTAEVPEKKPQTLVQFDRERKNLGVHAETEFNENYKSVFEELAKQAKEINPSITAESLENDFRDTLEKGKTIKEAWDYLKVNHCETAAIIEGIILFFAGEIGKNQISLNKFYSPVEINIEGNNTLRSSYIEMRKNYLQQSKQAMAALFGEKGLPQLPLARERMYEPEPEKRAA